MSEQEPQEQMRVQKALGTRIRSLREAKRWHVQRAFARACRMHPSSYGEVERGIANIRLSNLLQIAKRLKTTVSDLFDGIA